MTVQSKWVEVNTVKKARFEPSLIFN